MRTMSASGVKACLASVSVKKSVQCEMEIKSIDEPYDMFGSARIGTGFLRTCRLVSLVVGTMVYHPFDILDNSLCASLNSETISCTDVNFKTHALSH